MRVSKKRHYQKPQKIKSLKIYSRMRNTEVPMESLLLAAEDDG